MHHLAQTEMATIFHGSPSPHGYAHNAEKFFLQKYEVNHIQKALEKIDLETMALKPNIA